MKKTDRGINCRIKNFLVNLSDFFMPRFCASCGQRLPGSEDILCGECSRKIVILDKEILQAEYIKKFRHELIIRGFYTPYIFSEHSPIKDIIHKLKYEKRFRYGIFLGEKISNLGMEEIKSWKIDFIIPVPLHHLKKAERGYNQSFYIAKGISKTLEIPILKRAVKRIKYTKTQTALTLKERKENINGVFKSKNQKLLKNKNILLIDDVITTGATVSECGRELAKNGCGKIFAASSALASPEFQ